MGMTDTILRAQANGIELAYETFGDPGDPAVLLVMGLGTQMLAWPDPLCDDLAGRGFHVIRYDNRDVGLSSHFDDLPVPTLRDIMLRRNIPYSVGDMAADAVGLLDALGVPAAHVVGASMGGFIAQSLALQAPTRVLSLTLMMTSTGSRLVGQARPKLYSRLVRRRHIKDRDAAAAAAVETFRLIGSTGFEVDEEHLRDIGGRSYDRRHDPAGYLRQLAAVSAQPNRTRDLRRLTVPTVVLHGLHDPLVASSGGLALARAIPGARFVGYAGMGHDLPRALWPRFVDEIVTVAGAGVAGGAGRLR